ncbi:hypothetical protein R1flu_017889 [Riccia fluitans]|uniref:NB-ARC domain-containing protein n=1 Tax=Riccia fluitans TaxID=41844 RepID=A0ABD1ZGL1_9MARC
MLRSVCCKSRSWERCHLQLHHHSANQSHRRTTRRILQSTVSCSQRINKQANMASSSKRRVSSPQTENVGFQITSCLTQVHPRSPSHTTQIDIFFFHGLQLEGNSVPHLSTWRSGNASQELWPQTWLRTRYQDARIILLSYDASAIVTNTEGRMSLYAIAETLLQDILTARNGVGRNRPVILIGHSFGGLVIKQLCLYAHRRKGAVDEPSEVIDFLETIRGVFFYSTPHHGFSDEARSMLFNRRCDKTLVTNKALLRFVEVLDADAAILHQGFNNILKTYSWKICGVGEAHPIEGASLPLVPDASSRFGDEYCVLDCDHFSICKPENPKSSSYLQLVKLIDSVYEEWKDRKRRRVKYSLKAVGVDSLLSTIVEKHLREYQFLALWAMGGVGKTTIARLVFEELADGFEYACFVEDFKLIPGNTDELKGRIWDKMLHYGRPVPKPDGGHLRGEEPKDNLKDSIDEIVEGCGGLPLTLEILGTYLQSTRDEKVWDQVPVALRNAESIGDWEERLWAKLRISFDALQEEEKNMFLDVACVFNRDTSRFTYKQVEAAWASYNPSSNLLFQKLLDRSLVKVVEGKWRKVQIFQVHEHFRSIGDKIAKDLRRIYFYQDSEGQNTSHEIVRHDLQKIISYHAVIKKWNESESEEPVHLECSCLHPCSLCNLQEVLSKMTAVRYLDIRTGDALCRICLSKGGLGIPTGTAMVRYHGDARLLRFKPGARGLGKLAVLHLWLGGECFFPLLTPESCEYLPQALKLLSVMYLEKVEQKDVWHHLRIAWERLQRLQEVSLVSLSHEIYSFVKPPYEFASSSLNHERVFGCEFPLGTTEKLLAYYSDDKLPETFTELGTLKRLTISFSFLQKLPDTFGRLRQLVHLVLCDISSIKHLPWTFGELSRLEQLEIQDSEELESLPVTFGNLESLRRLTIVKCPKLLTLPSSFGELMRLENLKILHCPSLLSLIFFYQDELPSLKFVLVSSCIEGLGEEFQHLSSPPLVDIRL